VPAPQKLYALAWRCHPFEKHADSFFYRIWPNLPRRHEFHRNFPNSKRASRFSGLISRRREVYGNIHALRSTFFTPPATLGNPMGIALDKSF
jgi:hypothetical protein